MKFLLASVCILFVSCLCAPIFALELSRFDQLVPAFEERGYSGNCLVKQGNKVLLEASFGMADVDHARPHTLADRFGIGSATKQLTATAVLILKDRGLLKLDDNVDQLLPELELPWAKQVSVHELLTHTSGIFNYTEAPDFFSIVDGRGRDLKSQDLLSLFRDRPLNFIPGTHWSYSNSGFLLLGLIIEKLSRKSYAQFLEDEILRPLGMSETAFDPIGWRKDNALPIGFDENYEQHDMPVRPMAWAASAGGIMSTVEDFSRWMTWLHHGDGLLSAESRDLLHSPQVDTDVPGKRYGYGLGFGTAFATDWVGHGGDLPGFHFFDLYFKVKDIQIIVATNQEPSFVRSQIAQALMSQAILGHATLPDLLTNFALPAKQLQTFTGDYTAPAPTGAGPEIQARLFLKNERLYIQLEGQDAFWLIPQGPTKFALKNIGTIEFVNNEMLLNQDGQLRFKKR